MNKHEIKTRETRELLLQAAEKIFVRDGYEGAELGEIAALAGRTKGAIYAQFKSKEDIFLALIESNALRHRALMGKTRGESTSVEENRETYRQFSLQLLEDQAGAFLMLEYKLYALRHPESAARLQSYYAEIFTPEGEQRITRLLGASGDGKEEINRLAAVKILQPLLSTLVVEAKFSPETFGQDVIRKIANVIFEALLPSAKDA